MDVSREYSSEVKEEAIRIALESSKAIWTSARDVDLKHQWLGVPSYDADARCTFARRNSKVGSVNLRWNQHSKDSHRTLRKVSPVRRWPRAGTPAHAGWETGTFPDDGHGEHITFRPDNDRPVNDCEIRSSFVETDSQLPHDDGVRDRYQHAPIDPREPHPSFPPTTRAFLPNTQVYA